MAKFKIISPLPPNGAGGAPGVRGRIGNAVSGRYPLRPWLLVAPDVAVSADEVVERRYLVQHMSLDLAPFGHRSDDDEGLLLGAKRTCRLSFGQASELSVPLDWELLEEIVELEGGRLSAFEDSFDKGG